MAPTPVRSKGKDTSSNLRKNRETERYKMVFRQRETIMSSKSGGERERDHCVQQIRKEISYQSSKSGER